MFTFLINVSCNQVAPGHTFQSAGQSLTLCAIRAVAIGVLELSQKNLAISGASISEA